MQIVSVLNVLGSLMAICTEKIWQDFCFCSDRPAETFTLNFAKKHEDK